MDNMNQLIPTGDYNTLGQAWAQLSANDIHGNDMDLLLTLAPIGILGLTIVIAFLLALADGFRNFNLRMSALSILNVVLVVVALLSTVGHFAFWFSENFTAFVSANPNATLIDWIVHQDRVPHMLALVVGTKAQWAFTSQLFYGMICIIFFSYIEAPRCGIKRPTAAGLLMFLVSPAVGTALLLSGVLNADRQYRLHHHIVPIGRLAMTGAVFAMLCTILVCDVENQLGVVVTFAGSLLLPLFLAQMFPSAFYHHGPPTGIIILKKNKLTNKMEKHLDQRPLRHLWLIGSYVLIGGVSIHAHLTNLLFIVTEPQTGSVLLRVLSAITANHVQSKVSIDLLLVTCAIALYILFAGDGEGPMRFFFALLCFCPLSGVSFAFPMYLAYRETCIVPKSITTSGGSSNSSGKLPLSAVDGSSAEKIRQQKLRKRMVAEKAARVKAAATASASSSGPLGTPPPGSESDAMMTTGSLPESTVELDATDTPRKKTQ